MEMLDESSEDEETDPPPPRNLDLLPATSAAVPPSLSTASAKPFCQTGVKIEASSLSSLKLQTKFSENKKNSGGGPETSSSPSRIDMKSEPVDGTNLSGLTPIPSPDGIKLKAATTSVRKTSLESNINNSTNTKNFAKTLGGSVERYDKELDETSEIKVRNTFCCCRRQQNKNKQTKF